MTVTSQEPYKEVVQMALRAEKLKIENRKIQAEFAKRRNPNISSNRSYVSTAFASFSDRNLSPLEEEIVVHTPLGEQLIRNTCYRDYGIRVSKEEFKADLIPLEIQDFDLILALKLVRKGYPAYLVHVIDTSKGEPKLEDVPIVNEFSNVFSDELPGLPPDQEFEFFIDLFLGTAPISIPPYRMAPAELKELKVQLQELVDKGFIRPRKANVVADTLSRKSSSSLASLQNSYYPILLELKSLGIQLSNGKDGTLLASFVVKPSLLNQIKELQKFDDELKQEVQKLRDGETNEFRLGDDGILMLGNRVCVPKDDQLRRAILEEAYSFAYALHLRSTKMYRTIKEIVIRFAKRGKLNLRYIGPFRVIERTGLVAYRLELPPELDRIHNVFHVSMLKKFVPDPSHILEAPLIKLQEDLKFEVQPVRILDRKY
ncbi:PREDICTED: uncharacterized protein LOC108661393 [Theobroma cacao]|uniref:Uncharacterized protein LOC108661393 n=1 Tax=Theobroma cacao TaxID=3641 RepID=A0AB32W1F9_THECC|nr:PREDICTED: uncharacterized protein LOC108661393 [Theobroma cacao]